ncbi:MAG TPA: hypothetical protein VH835_04505, partial [Dongiaceae bacterium]
RLIEFRDRAHRLVACVLTDWAADGISAVYSFFDPALSPRSLGSYMVCRRTQRRQISYLPVSRRRHTASISPSTGLKLAL